MHVPVSEAIDDEAALPERVGVSRAGAWGREGRLLALSVEVGLGVLLELSELEVEQIIGPKGPWKWGPDRGQALP